MPNNIITFRVNDRQARAGFSRLKREVDELDNEFKDTRREAREAGEAIDRLGDEAQQSATQVDTLGNAAKRNNAVWRDTNGVLRDARGRFASAGQGAGIFENSLGGANQGVGSLTQSLGGMRGILAGLGIAVAAREMFEFGRASVDASVQIDSFTRALAALEGNSLIAETRIRELQILSDQPGLRFRGAVQGALALRAIGTEAELTTRILRELGNAAAFTDTGGEFERGLLGLRQIIARGRISQEELNQLTENISIASKVIQDQFGTVLAEEIQAQLDDAGQSVDDFVEQLISGFERLERFPIDASSVKLKNLSNSFFELKAGIGDLLLPTVSAAASGLTVIFDGIAEGTRNIRSFFDVIDERHNALLNASESAREFAIRFAEINAAVGQIEAVDARITNLQRLTIALRKEQSELSHSSQEYLEYAERIRTAANEIDLLRSIQQAGTGSTANENLINQRTQALETANAEIQRYEQALAAARQEAVGRTNPAIQQLERRLEAQQTTAATLTREMELLKNGFQDISPTVNTAAEDVVNYSLAIAKLRAEAEDAIGTQNFQAALAASNAYYDARITKAQEALAAETKGAEAYNALETQIFELRRQRLRAERQITVENQRSLQQLSRQRIDAANAARTAEIESFNAAALAGRAYAQQLENISSLSQRRAFFDYVNQLVAQGQSFDDARQQAERFFNQISRIPDAAGPDAQYGNFTSELRRDFEETERQGQSLLDVMRQIASQAFATDLDARIPDTGVRGQAIDERIAAEARGQQTLTDIRQAAAEQGRQFLSRIRQSEDRELQRSLRQQVRQYRQFANLVSNTFIDLATGRAKSFESVAAAFIQQSIRIALRAFVEFQLQKRLDDTLTTSKIANIQKVAAAQQASAGIPGIGSLGNLPGLGNLGSSLSGGGAALGVSALLFPQEIRNLTGGITDTISNLLSNVASAPDKAFGAQQVFLKIGENETREITDLQDELRQDERV